MGYKVDKVLKLKSQQYWSDNENLILPLYGPAYLFNCAG